MDLNLAGKVAVITGGTAGIGEACVLAFLRENCKVAVCGRSRDKLDQLKNNMAARGYEIYIQQADVSRQQEIRDFAQAVYEHYGKIDIWVNNAGIAARARLIEMSEEDWDLVLNTNLKSVFLGSQVAAQYMVKGGGGVILNASSYAAVIPQPAVAPTEPPRPLFLI
ncbi:Glucose 1-dehydrogenase [Sporomusa termitida]|uniref:Glucose 1-dehydrogenase n=1 Tax=Sporomusa termitida TaxID=2377 RepID=A0A517DNU7_9FIRM|nr:Glucose 1-dehydrogenase [Sporomusa termitida]